MQGRTPVARLSNDSTKGTAVFTLYAILFAASIAGVVGSIALVARDGYRRMPRETFARTV
ncbi:hypothetical protein [Agromyces marinus]|uniref:Uncharacterized protein n=1 Tax=Agromyces marinus TaxID=1389020 RepID=A0ABM8H2Q2_9MICO|nr:hypothetical protein [Agromyces marinus]BDZ55053.1 hypothetical protein GCM10025870_21260 [Agromyces marinus]